MKRILFVDDEHRALSGLRRQFHGLRDEWAMTFAAGGPEAVAMIRTEALDVIVTDMRMPEIDGAQVMAVAAEEQPAAGRLVLSGHAEHDRRRMASTCAHRYLNKPCPPQALEAEIRRALSMREALDELADERLVAIWNQPPGLLAECALVLAALHTTPIVLPNEVATLLRQDEVLGRRVAGAVGTDHDEDQDRPSFRGVLTAIMSVRLLQTCGPIDERTWEGAVHVAAGAVRIAREHGLSDEDKDDTRIAGLLHAFLTRHANRRHADVLAYLLPTWGFSDGVVEALTVRPHELLEAAQSRELEPGPITALLAARHALGDGDGNANEIAAYLDIVGWGAAAHGVVSGV